MEDKSLLFEADLSESLSESETIYNYETILEILHADKLCVIRFLSHFLS